jgi:hypothetical protein
MARSKKIQVIDPADEEIDPRLAALAALRDELPEGGEVATTAAATTMSLPVSAGAPSTAPTGSPDLEALEAEVRRLQEEARARRRTAEAKKAEADQLRARLEALTQERARAQALLRQLAAEGAWVGDASRLEASVRAHLQALEEEARALAVRLQELEADEGVRRLRAEEAARAEAEKAKAQAERARQLAREGKLAEALASLPARPEEGSPAAEARQELLRIAHRVVGGAVFRAREALAAGEAERALKEVQGVARLLPHVQGEDRRAAQGLFCQAAHRLAPAGQPLVLIRGQRVERRGRVVWTAPPGTLAVGVPVQGGAQVLFNLGTPWQEGAVVRVEEADIQPLRTRHGDR